MNEHEGKPKAVAITESQVPNLAGINAFLEQATPRIAALVGKVMRPERIVRVAIAAISRNPLLMQCTKESIVLALIESAQLGLELSGVTGEAYLVPYRNNKRGGIYEAQFQIGYRGLMKLARRSSDVLGIMADAVRAGDEFAFRRGTKPEITHIPLTGERGPITHFYAVAFMREGQPMFEVMTLEEIEAIRKRSKAAGEGPWVTDYEMMGRKTVIRRLAKYLPLESNAAGAVEMDAQVEAGARATMGHFTGELLAEAREVGYLPPGESEAPAPNRTEQVARKLHRRARGSRQDPEAEGEGQDPGPPENATPAEPFPVPFGDSGSGPISNLTGTAETPTPPSAAAELSQALGELTIFLAGMEPDPSDVAAPAMDRDLLVAMGTRALAGEPEAREALAKRVSQPDFGKRQAETLIGLLRQYQRKAKAMAAVAPE